MDKSAPSVANQATSDFVEERKLTRDLVHVGLQLIEKGYSISESAIDERMVGSDDTPFPSPEKKCKNERLSVTISK